MAVPHPDQELARVQQVCRQGLPPLMLLAGAGTWFRETALAKAIAAIPKDAEVVTVDGNDVEIRGVAAAPVEGDESDDGDGEDGDGTTAAATPAPQHCKDLDVLRGGGLFFRRAYVVVRRGDRWLRRYAQALAQAMPRFAAGCGVLIETQKVDKRFKFFKEAADKGTLFEFRELYAEPWDRTRGPLEGELVKWVVGRSQQLGVALTPESAWLLCEQVGRGPGELLAELERLAQTIGPQPGRKPLAPADLRGKVSVAFESTPFELAEAVLARNRAAAFRSLRAMFDRGVKAKDGKPMDHGGKFPFATSWLFQSLAQLHEGSLLVEQGVRADDVPARLGVRGFPERYIAQLKKNDRESLERGLLHLLQCQRDKRLTGEDDDVLLERFLTAWFERALPAERELEW